MSNVVFIAGIGAFIALSISIPIVVSYFLDRRTHDGVDWLKRRRVRRHGRDADATVLSSTLVVTKPTGSKYNGAYSIVYEVHPSDAPAFRAKAIEVMYFSEARANGLEAGKTVPVRFDPSDQTVVLMRVDVDQARRDKDDQRRAKEDALLRGP